MWFEETAFAEARRAEADLLKAEDLAEQDGIPLAEALAEVIASREG